ncbi:MAG: alpha/beta fold hydrolase [Candidatus Pelagadaptatus aseana]
MNRFTQMLLDQGLAFNQKFSETAANGVDWLFRHDTLVKSGQTWFELILDGDPMSVRYYELPGEDEIELADGSTMEIQQNKHDIPLVLVPPLGVTTETFDLMPQRSLVRYMVAQGYKVYLVDWGKPTKEHKRLNLRDYSYHMMSEALAKVREHSGSEQLSMMGWCMGGLLCLLHQGQVKDPNIRNIVTVASPIDLQGGGVIAGVSQALNGPAQLVKNYGRMSMKDVDSSLMSLPPWMTTLAFKLTAPVASVTTYWDLLTRLWDREFVESHSTTSDYLNNMLRYPGGVLQDMTAKVIVDNQLAKGKLELSDGTIAELDTIESSLLVFAGQTDHLVPPSIAQASTEVVATEDTEFHVAPGGHMGVILGSKAQKVVWKESAKWLASRSSH